MQTIGSILQSLRLKQGLSLDNISQQTNIATYLLERLEHDDYTQLPASTFTKGFITSFAKVVGLSPQKALAIFRRDFTITQSGKIMPRGLAKPLDKSTVVTSKLLIMSSIGILVLLFIAYIFYQLQHFSLPPQIEIERPKTQSIVKGPMIPVKGFASADSSVYVNNQITEIFPTGEFKTIVQLPQGNQNITIKAVNPQNKSTQVTIPVYVVDK